MTPKACLSCLQSILVSGKPHLGTDRLVCILQAFRQHLTDLGVKICFGTCAENMVVQHDKVTGVQLQGMISTAQQSVMLPCLWPPILVVCGLMLFHCCPMNVDVTWLTAFTAGMLKYCALTQLPCWHLYLVMVHWLGRMN